MNYEIGLRQLAARYESMHPDVTVRLDFIPQDFGTWIRTQFAGGVDLAPDIYNGNFTQSFETLGRWVCLNPYLESRNPYTGEAWEECFDMRHLYRMQAGEKHYLVALDYIATGVFYNQDLFDELGLVPPDDWSELIALCEKIRDKGYIPFAVPGSSDVGPITWIVRMLTDAYFRDLTPLIVSRPGDWDYVASRNDGWAPSPSDPNNDERVVINRERYLRAILEGDVNFEGPRIRAAYERLKEFSQYFQKGFLGGDESTAHRLFLNQRALIELATSAQVTGAKKEMADLGDAAFNWGVFTAPNIEDDPLCAGPLRIVGGPGAMFAVTNKGDPEHEKRVLDFLMFITTPESMQLLVNETLKADRPIIGPPIIEGVQLPAELEEKFKPFMEKGLVRLDFITGLHEDAESMFRLWILVDDFLASRISLDEFCERYQSLMIEATHRVVRRNGVDLNPRTGEVSIAEASKRSKPGDPIEWTNGTIVVSALLGAFLGWLALSLLRTPTRGWLRGKTLTSYCLILPSFVLAVVFL
ncbi:MAG: extracellular solute-binding protein, partial [Candidatus Omnitrophica bacterium]|nr:extracellular solute-binding protein [Candidatus Omnitrophota bacterium]